MTTKTIEITDEMIDAAINEMSNVLSTAYREDYKRGCVKYAIAEAMKIAAAEKNCENGWYDEPGGTAPRPGGTRCDIEPAPAKPLVPDMQAYGSLSSLVQQYRAEVESLRTDLAALSERVDHHRTMIVNLMTSEEPTPPQPTAAEGDEAKWEAVADAGRQTEAAYSYPGAVAGEWSELFDTQRWREVAKAKGAVAKAIELGLAARRIDPQQVRQAVDACWHDFGEGPAHVSQCIYSHIASQQEVAR